MTRFFNPFAFLFILWKWFFDPERFKNRLVLKVAQCTFMYFKNLSDKEQEIACNYSSGYYPIFEIKVTPSGNGIILTDFGYKYLQNM